MAESSSYAWDFDHPSPQTIEIFSTFSVGVFQWLTKASGKGLKKSKAISRVLGYTAEPERVFQKAVELCARLNREGASAASPPSWLQKQYSVPRPAGMVVERTSHDFTAAQVRAMRLKVMKEQLLPAGFVVGKDASYVRRHEDQIHFVNFQSSQYGHRFTVNFGFHYVFIPPDFRAQSQSLADFHFLDCVAEGRIGRFLPENRDTWFKYGEDRELLIANLQLCAATCLSVFHRYAERWRDPSAMLADLTDDRGRPWSYQRGLTLGWLELRSGLVEAAEARLAAWSGRHSDTSTVVYTGLMELLEEYRKLRDPAVEQLGWKNWVFD